MAHEKRVRWRWLVVPGLLLIGALLTLVAAAGGCGDKRVESFPNARDGLMLFAHRGVVTPQSIENTEPAVRLAREKLFPGIEVDIQVSCDGQVLLFHDSDGERLLHAPIKVNERTLAELKALDARIMSGQELMAYKSDFAFYFDVKRYWIKNPFTAAKLIGEFIRKHGIGDRVVVGCVDAAFIMCLEYLDGSLKTCLETPGLIGNPLYGLIPRKVRPDFLGSARKNLPTDRLRANHHLERLIVWGLNRAELAELRKLGVRNFIVDYDPGFDDLLRQPATAK